MPKKWLNPDLVISGDVHPYTQHPTASFSKISRVHQRMRHGKTHARGCHRGIPTIRVIQSKRETNIIGHESNVKNGNISCQNRPIFVLVR